MGELGARTWLEALRSRGWFSFFRVRVAAFLFVDLTSLSPGISLSGTFHAGETWSLPGLKIGRVTQGVALAVPPPMLAFW